MTRAASFFLRQVRVAIVAAAPLSPGLFPAARAERIVFPPEAIVDAMHLPETDFRLLNPGIDIAAIGLTDEGFYVRYVHENLVHYFGPISELLTARGWRDDLLVIRDRLIEKRPVLADSRVELVRFTRDQLKGLRSSDVNGDGRVDGDDDINGDGVIDGRDVEAFRDAGRGADVNGDGVVDERDDINGDGVVDGDDIRAHRQSSRGGDENPGRLRRLASERRSDDRSGDVQMPPSGDQSSEGSDTRDSGRSPDSPAADRANPVISPGQGDSSSRRSSGGGDATPAPASSPSGGVSIWELLRKILFGR